MKGPTSLKLAILNETVREIKSLTRCKSAGYTWGDSPCACHAEFGAQKESEHLESKNGSLNKSRMICAMRMPGIVVNKKNLNHSRGCKCYERLRKSGECCEQVYSNAHSFESCTPRTALLFSQLGFSTKVANIAA